MGNTSARHRPPFGMPEGIVLLRTPGGWRHSILTTEGGMASGRLDRALADTEPDAARDAATTLVVELARDFHGTDVEVRWDPPGTADVWTGSVHPLPRHL
ncbi:hypothetical protein [Streptomyces avicenniae]|uniref:hypothetical protein n=1 Tax=Streptomyces avicenniae TaxID=500153 RepID=UPI000AA7FED5|nr:hypothetical protein [Streptomyces avicenniae]